MSLIHTFLDLADDTVFKTLSPLDIHNLCNTCKDIDTRVTRRLAFPPRPRVALPRLTAAQKEECTYRMRKARLYLELDDELFQAVRYHKAMFRRLLEAAGPKGSISRDAFLLIDMGETHRPMLSGRSLCETRFSHSHTDIETTVRGLGFGIKIYSSLTGTHNALIGRDPHSSHSSLDLAYAVEIARMFGVKTYTYSPRCDANDPLVRFHM